VLGMVNAMPEFGHQPEVINGCSDLFVEVFGDRGRHARSAVGMGSLPRGIPVEIEVIVEVEADEPEAPVLVATPKAAAKPKAAVKPAAQKRSPAPKPMPKAAAKVAKKKAAKKKKS